MKYLINPVNAASYLNAFAEDGETKFLLKALRNVVEAQGGIGELAKKTKLSRTTLYKTLSPTGNPEVETMECILAVYGLPDFRRGSQITNVLDESYLKVGCLIHNNG